MWWESIAQDPGQVVWFVITVLAGVGVVVFFFEFIKWTFNIK